MGALVESSCKECGTGFSYERVGRRGRIRRFCSDKCKNLQDYKRPGYNAHYWANKKPTNIHECKICGAEFLSKQHVARVCGQDCLRVLMHRPTGRIPKHKRLDGKRDQRSEAAKAYRPWYRLARWVRIRDAQLKKEPLCRMCHALGHITAATVCDHITPHKGDPKLFWEGPFQSLCTTHHNRDKQQEERTGRLIGNSSDGSPLDPSHHWAS